jgi:hypothetical protein
MKETSRRVVTLREPGGGGSRVREARRKSLPSCQPKIGQLVALSLAEEPFLKAQNSD